MICTVGVRYVNPTCPLRESDLVQGGSEDVLIGHQALHARRIAFVHPIQEKPLEIEAPLPANIARIMELLEAHRAG